MIYCLGCSLIYGTINVLFKKKQKRLLQYASLNEVQEDPTSYQLFLEELYEKYLKAIQVKGGNYLEVMGMLNLHQEQCQNIDCPCISGVLENNQEDIDNDGIDTDFLSEEELERGLTKQIKNRIMQKDKAASYSYKLKIADEAKHISELENIVHSEQEIQTQKRNDSVLDSTIISSLSILSGKVGSIVASFRNNELDGKILSFSQRFPEILGYEYQEFKEFKNLRVIMPKVVADIHEIFISRLINTGKPLFSNYHFQLMDQFAFSALILKLEPKIMLLLVDKFGHICGINQIFQEKLGCMGIDPLYFNQLHQALFFPQILDFYSKYDVEGPQEDLNFLKQMMNFPKPFEITNYIEEFLIHYKEFQKKEFKSDAQKFKSLQNFFTHFYNNICIDHNLINIGDPKLETTMQLLPEKIPTGTGGLVELFVVIVHQWKEIDEQKTSSLGMSMGATDLDGNTQSNHYQQQYRGNTYVSSLNMSRQFDKLQTDFANNNNINNNSNIVRGLIQNSEEIQKPGQFEEQDQKLAFDNILDKYEEDNKLKIQKEQSYRSNKYKHSKENTFQNSQNNKLIDKRSRFYCVVEESDKSTEKQDLNQIGPQDQEIETEENDLSLKMRKTDDSNDVQFGDEFQAEKGNAQASVSSSIQSVEVGALKQIKMFTKDKSYPREIIFLYLTFCLRIERICQVVSRITEKEAYYEIYMINSIQSYLLDHQELYLHCVFTNYDINKWDKSGQQESVKNKSQKSRNSQRSEKKLYKPKRGKNESGILTDRIHESKLNYNAIYIIVAILFFLSIGFFITVFIYVSQFKNNFQPFIDSFSGFIQASNKYGIATSSEMLTYVNYIYKNTDEEKYLYNQEIFKSIIEDQDTIINSSQQYFSQDFYQVSLGGEFNDQFQEFLYYINNEDICENSQVIQEYEKQLCEQADSDILSKGIQLAIKQVFNKISKNDIENWTQEQIINYINKNTFEDDFILYVMVQKIFLGISDQYSIANKDMKEAFLYILHLMFLIGGIIYGLLFLILVAYFISNLQKDYILIKSAIQVVPYHRLAEDHTTHHLLKRIFKF
ncbi:hypothetical protein PPERSA_05114 [Pseudocohnilembus persalinus]|uniref:PAS domain n=1 Tax=Pseudocohnilembus persalinus TaxID=266149 RepID=A0A0V0QXB6_PSEPJ|nr:hypothetical protein PPERSA_05114 [Pseudocohnilembus persalinus]|eukprot:KRX06501.1 hypothetical protein PPERSA_05114 [Pseudocohnilembus persalinus]